MAPIQSDVLEKYIKAGKAVAKALKLAEQITRPGTKYIDLANLIEGEILKNGCGLAFPINMSLNEQAAHYSPVIGDTLKCPEHGLIKIDCGSHCDGYIADAAITVNLGKDKGVYEDLTKGVSDAIDEVLKHAKEGVDVVDLGRLIHYAMTKNNVKPVSNLGGHGLDRYNLHAGVFIPNTPLAGESYKLKEGCAYACEPFSTNGAGRINEGKEITIYLVQNVNKKNLTLPEKAMAQKFKAKFSSLPFSPRAIDFIEGKDKIYEIVDQFYKKGILHGYKIFLEIAKGLVAQKEHTFIVTKTGVIATTLYDNGL
jgi:methionyl aminopeptidase